VFNLSAVLIISLAWRKVVLESKMYNQSVDPVALKIREERIRKLVLTSCVVLFALCFILISLGKRFHGSFVLLFAYIVSGVVLVFKSGRKFVAEINSASRGRINQTLSTEGAEHSRIKVRCVLV
jgi:Na+/H+ antiporter NhaD/arsenite permease-like protein